MRARLEITPRAWRGLVPVPRPHRPPVTGWAGRPWLAGPARRRFNRRDVAGQTTLWPPNTDGSIRGSGGHFSAIVRLADRLGTSPSPLAAASNIRLLGRATQWV